MRDNIYVKVGGVEKTSSTYVTKILKPGQLDFDLPNTKYVIKWDFDLENKVVHIPNNCLIEFDGGSISNGVLNCDNTIIINYQDVESVLKNIQLAGTYKFASYNGPNIVILDENEEPDEYDINTIYFKRDEDGKILALQSLKGLTANITYPSDFVVQTDLNTSTAIEPLKNVKYQVKDEKGNLLFEFWTIVLLYYEKPPTYTITFVTNGGSSINPISVAYGLSVVLPTITRSGYSFDGWYANSSFGGTKYSGSFTPLSNITLYAKWEEIRFPNVWFISSDTVLTTDEVNQYIQNNSASNTAYSYLKTFDTTNYYVVIQGTTHSLTEVVNNLNFKYTNLFNTTDIVIEGYKVYHYDRAIGVSVTWTFNIS